MDHRLLQLRLFHRFQLFFIPSGQVRQRVRLPLYALSADLAASTVTGRSLLQLHNDCASEPP